ncbi:MAG: hypothetical protein WAM53_12835 [Terrimicrobiaceae bacterium]
MKDMIKSLILAVGRLFAERFLSDQTIVGIFGNTRYLERAVERLIRARFEHFV